MELIQQNGAVLTKENLFLSMSKEIYHWLESAAPGFLKTDVYKYAKAKNLPVEPLKPFTYVEILMLDMAQLFVLPKAKNGSPNRKETHREITKSSTVGSNSSSYATPIVTKANLTLGNISNPYEIIHVSPLLSSWTWVECLQTSRNQGGKSRKCRWNH